METKKKLILRIKINTRNAAKWKHEDGGRVHKPFGHRSILDNGWQSTKQLKNKKNIWKINIY